jgi:cytochrome c oxidase assembly protein subunit 15
MNGHRFFRGFSIVVFLGTYITILTGGNVMASGSGSACPDWPTCSGSLVGPLSGPMGIEWAHRLTALGLSTLVLGLALAAILVESRRPILRNLALACLLLVVAQALLGGLVVTSDLVVGLVLTHLALATVLFALTFLLALLSNLREIPKTWIEWAMRAEQEEAPTASDAAGRPYPSRGPVGGLAEATARAPEP